MARQQRLQGNGLDALDDVTSVGFFVTDINDVNALLRVQSFQPFSHGLDNGQIFHITVTDSAGMGGLQFLSDAGSSQNDGFGIDGFTIAGPEPDSLFLLGPGAGVPSPTACSSSAQASPGWPPGGVSEPDQTVPLA